MNQSEFDAAYENLSRKQRTVLKEFLAGRTDEEIADTIGVQDRSGIRHHISNICRQFDLKNESDESYRQREDLIALFYDYKPELVSSQVLEKYQVLVRSKESEFFTRQSLERHCYETLLQPGSLVRIKGLKQMGKTHLVTRVFARLKQEGYQTINLSLELADRQQCANLENFLRWFCEKINRELHLSNKLDEFWEEDLGSKTNCTNYFEDCILPENETPLVLCLDNIDLIFSHPEVYDDLFPLLRSWYDLARSHTHSPWKKLRLVLAYSTEPYVHLNINQSPFNVGVVIELLALEKEEIRQFSQSYGLDLSTPQIENLISMVGGHPYLLELAFSHLKTFPNLAFDRLLAIAPTEDGIYGDHLRQLWLALQEKPELAKAFEKVVTTTDNIQLNPIQNHQLHRLGLIQRQGNEVKPRCELYRLYFRDRLGDI